MPCYYTGSAEGDARLAAEESAQAATELTRLLCAICSKAERENFSMPKSVAKWWEAHSKIDKKRREQKKAERSKKELAKQARKKLTDEELKALGLKE